MNGLKQVSSQNRPLIIGLTGYRGVGKTTAAEILVSEHGFTRVHPYDGGKVAARAFFARVTGSDELAERMVYGDLKDAPCELLPDNASPRFFMEKDGYFRASELGHEWTLGLELDRAIRCGATRIVIESVVYEAAALRARGGLIYRITRAGDRPDGMLTDGAQENIAVDGEIENNGTIESLSDSVCEMATGWINAMSWVRSELLDKSPTSVMEI